MDIFSIRDIHCRILTFIPFGQLCSTCKRVSHLWHTHAADDICYQCLNFHDCYQYILHSHSNECKLTKKYSKSRLSLKKLSMDGFGSHAKKFTFDIMNHSLKVWSVSKLIPHRWRYVSESTFAHEKLADTVTFKSPIMKLASQFQYFSKIESFTLKMPELRCNLQSHYWTILSTLLSTISYNSCHLKYLYIDGQMLNWMFIRDCKQSFYNTKSCNPIIHFLNKGKFCNLQTLILKNVYLTNDFATNITMNNFTNLKHLSLSTFLTTYQFWIDLTNNGKHILQQLTKLEFLGEFEVVDQIGIDDHYSQTSAAFGTTFFGDTDADANVSDFFKTKIHDKMAQCLISLTQLTLRLGDPCYFEYLLISIFQRIHKGNNPRLNFLRIENRVFILSCIECNYNFNSIFSNIKHISIKYLCEDFIKLFICKSSNDDNHDYDYGYSYSYNMYTEKISVDYACTLNKTSDYVVCNIDKIAFSNVKMLEINCVYGNDSIDMVVSTIKSLINLQKIMFSINPKCPLYIKIQSFCISLLSLKNINVLTDLLCQWLGTSLFHCIFEWKPINIRKMSTLLVNQLMKKYKTHLYAQQQSTIISKRLNNHFCNNNSRFIIQLTETPPNCILVSNCQANKTTL